MTALLSEVMSDPKLLPPLRVLKNGPREHKNYGAGPWSDEPDEAAHVMHGFVVEVRRNGLGGLCGYIHIPNDHPWFHNSGDHSPHGGVTFTADDPLLGTWQLGFDCGHSGDYLPALRDHGNRGQYRTLRYVLAELDEWAVAAANAAHRNPYSSY